MNQTELTQVIQRAASDERENLDLNNQAITSIPDDIRSLKKLRGLHLLGNQLVEVPPAILELKELRVLSLARNRLERLPPGSGAARSGRKKLKMPLEWPRWQYCSSARISSGPILL